MHICTVTITLVHLCTILHPLIWVFFCSKCVKCTTFYILQNYAWYNASVLVSNNGLVPTSNIKHQSHFIYTNTQLIQNNQFHWSWFTQKKKKTLNFSDLISNQMSIPNTTSAAVPHIKPQRKTHKIKFAQN